MCGSLVSWTFQGRSRVMTSTDVHVRFQGTRASAGGAWGALGGFSGIHFGSATILWICTKPSVASSSRPLVLQWPEI